ncbi:DUF2971 domain-containing protein [Oceanospirillum sanctuarii]|uniref:DUF2971 domain-containing protein n=1 Tax=Oceanospirillum sanctuarii TaxID=1434821 RepID=UPI000A39D10B|nr:DUF2971 domain-containing protein [Oceanospirillum sanctuarii]
MEHVNGITGVPIYRYEPIVKEESECRIESLRDGRLYISDPESFNDPFDIQLSIRDLSYRSGFTEEELNAALQALFKGYQPVNAHWLFNENILEELKLWLDGGFSSQENIIHHVKKHLKTFGVQCFSSCYEIPLSWAHYASGHSGFCIEYDLRKMEFAGKNGHELRMHDVTYSSLLPEVCLSEVLFTPHQAIKKLLATKTIDWAYEQEFRLVHFTKKATKIDMPEGLRMNSLIGGMNMSKDNFEKLKGVGKELAIPVCRMQGSSRPGRLWERGDPE